MVKIKNNGKYTNFRSINGHSLKLYINNEPISLRVVVLNSTKALHKEFIVLILLVSLQTLFLTIEAGSLYVVIVIFFICLFSYRIFIYAIEENLVIIKGLGIHIETKYIIGSKALFIPHEKVQNVFINEVILRNKIVFILTLLISNEKEKENLVPLFVETLPRLGMLTVVYTYIYEKVHSKRLKNISENM